MDDQRSVADKSFIDLPNVFPETLDRMICVVLEYLNVGSSRVCLNTSVKQNYLVVTLPQDSRKAIVSSVHGCCQPFYLGFDTFWVLVAIVIYNLPKSSLE